MVPRSGERFHKVLLDTVLGAPMSFFSTTDTGVTVNRFSQDLMLIDMELPISALNTFASMKFLKNSLTSIEEPMLTQLPFSLHPLHCADGVNWRCIFLRCHCLPSPTRRRIFNSKVLPPDLSTAPIVRPRG